MSCACPTRDDLAAYALGKLPRQRCEEIDTHLDQCGTCQAEMETCGNADDTFLARLRGPESSDEFLDEPECAEVMERVAAIGREPSFTTQKQLDGADHERAVSGAIGPYRLLAKLGEGGMGAVYKALHPKLKRVVALKLLPAERMRDDRTIARFEREMEAVGKLDHHHIVRATDAGEHDGTHFLVMEYVDGADLSDLGRRSEPLPIAEACEIIRQAAIGLQHAHKHGLVHRDIKPSNLMVTHDGTVKILDLGLALLPDSGDGARELTETNQAMGTLDYMAPEQGGDSHDVDIRADIYGLGATLYKLLTGQSIFSGRRYQTPIQKWRALAVDDAPQIQSRRADIPDRLAAVVHRMIARDKDDRYGTPGEVATALAPFCTGTDLAGLVQTLGAGAQTQDQPVSTHSSTTSLRKEAASLDTATRTQKSEQPGPTDAVAATASLQPAARRGAIIAVAVALLLALGGASLWAILLKIETDAGTVVLEYDGPEMAGAEVSIDGEKKITITPGGNEEPVTIEAPEGKRKLKVSKAGFEAFVEEFSISDGEKKVIRVHLEPHPERPRRPAETEKPARNAAWQPTPQQQAFFSAVRQLPAEKQLEAVADALKQANPNFDGEVEHEVESGVVTQLAVHGNELTDLWPVAALASLQQLDCSQTNVVDLAPLGRLDDLRSLNCSQTPLENLTFAARLEKLEFLDCTETDAFDLSPLEGLPLKELRCWFFTAYHEPSVAVMNSLPQLETVNGVPPAELLARKEEVENLRKILLALTPERQLDRVAETLKRYNPSFDGTVHGSIGEITISSPGLVDLSPLRALQKLESLIFYNEHAFADLSPLRGLSLRVLHCNASEVADLSPLEGMPLEELNCGATRVADLSPLEGMPLEDLNCGGSRVADLSPLEGMPLKLLRCQDLRGVSDLSPLEGMALKTLSCYATSVSDLSPLEGMPLKTLACSRTSVSDLSPLKGMALEHLDCGQTRVANLSLLEGMPLKLLRCQDLRGVSDLSPLEDMPLERLECGSTSVSDLSPLKGMALYWLDIRDTRVSDLSPVKEMPLKYLNCYFTRISDLTPLKGMPLSQLTVNRTLVADLTPLQGTPLTSLVFDLRLYVESDETVLKSLSLEGIRNSHQPHKDPSEYWNEVEARRRSAEKFATETAQLPAEQQLEVVTAKLKELNGHSHYDLQGKSANGAVVEARLKDTGNRNDPGACDLTALMAFTELEKLTLTGAAPDWPPYWLDISCVKHLPLEELNCSEEIAFKNAPVLRKMETLKTINGRPAGEFLQQLQVDREPSGGQAAKTTISAEGN